MTKIDKPRCCGHVRLCGDILEAHGHDILIAGDKIHCLFDKGSLLLKAMMKMISA
jgi:hypothetical protein